MTLKYTDSDLSAALAKGREEGIAAALQACEGEKSGLRKVVDGCCLATICWAQDKIRALAPSSPGEPAMTDLLPCPFCGGIPEAVVRHRAIGAGDMGAGSSAGSVTDDRVVCRNCGGEHCAPNPWSRFHWNTRAPSALPLQAAGEDGSLP